jgi:hypothetical protein
VLALALSPLAASGSEREVRLGFLGDAGTGGKHQKEVRDQLLAWTPSVVFLLGDNVYDEGAAKDFKSKFDDVYAPLFERGTVFHAALGNHDVKNCDAGEQDLLGPGAEAYRWRRRGCDVEHHLSHTPFGYVDGRRYYSVTLGGVPPEALLEVFVLDSNTLGRDQNKLGKKRRDGAQLAWLDGALGSSRARWKVVVLHHPIYTPRARGYFLGFGGHSRDRSLEAQLGSLLRKHSVDVVFSGHNHFYARVLPQSGVRQFVAGGGGARTLSFKPAPGYVAAGGKFHHFVYVRATDEAFEYYAIDKTGRSRDAGWFGKRDSADTPFPAGTLPPR